MQFTRISLAIQNYLTIAIRTVDWQWLWNAEEPAQARDYWKTRRLRREWFEIVMVEGFVLVS